MIISMDFDNTFSLAPEDWLDFMLMMRKRGHEVIVVTGRRENVYPEDFDIFHQYGFKVYKTKWLAKRVYMREVEGIEVDVWIDDCPEAILTNCEGQPKAILTTN